ncbi:IS66 family insertion sequence element accessory protein TnpB [Bradyrhizobium brasilense]|uniref:IS66 family insertion sequence element accessory protein TnpB n=1 Tax=Bradyrhizobium brasilense TaxID=1419277 RepID=A0ABY8JAF0_9BRAD|nr:IS66 family insertion sequence element accessory protein TnpB [Bradyrhizobium brasilense]WFU62545.1 IS66 family insertion sequence element accessory protein TnpB [Bradyrhizobium brasilense]
MRASRTVRRAAPGATPGADSPWPRACLFTKGLERGRFVWPSVASEAVTVSPAQMSYLLSGIDWRHPQETHRPTRVG